MDYEKEIRKSLIDLDVTITELADEMDVDRSTVYRQFETMNIRKYDAMVAAIKRVAARKAGTHK